MNLSELREGLKNSNEDWAVRARNLMSAVGEFENKKLSAKNPKRDSKKDSDGSKL